MIKNIALSITPRNIKGIKAITPKITVSGGLTSPIKAIDISNINPINNPIVLPFGKSTNASLILANNCAIINGGDALLQTSALKLPVYAETSQTNKPVKLVEVVEQTIILGLFGKS
jgi:hypothetical protein